MDVFCLAHLLDVDYDVPSSEMNTVRSTYDSDKFYARMHGLTHLIAALILPIAGLIFLHRRAPHVPSKLWMAKTWSGYSRQLFRIGHSMGFSL